MIKQTKNKLFTYQNAVILASIIPIIVFGFLTYQNFKKENLQNNFEQIKKINEQKYEIVKNYFDQAKFDIQNLSKTVSFLQEQASQSITNIQILQRNHLQDYYNLVQNSILSLAKKDIFEYIYSFKNRGKSVNETYLKDIYNFKKDLGIKNVLMINPSGKILYSSDYKILQNKNIKNITKPFGKVFKEIKNTKYNGKQSIYFVNFGYDKYTKQYEHFVISPFKDVDGFIAMQIDQKKIQTIIEHLEALGNTAETYLVYKDGDETHLASKRTVKNGRIGDKKENIYIKKGFNESGVDIKYGSLDTMEIVGYMPVKIKNITFSMQTTVAYVEVISPKIKGSDYFEEFILSHNYRNLMFVGTRGDLFYSIKKDDDFRANMFGVKYKDTLLGKGVKKVFDTKKLYITDMGVYKPCPNQLAQFVLAPILNNKGEIKSVAVLQFQFNTLSKKLRRKNEIYKTLETYIVGEDKRLRTDTVLQKERYSLVNSFNKDFFVDTKMIENTFNGLESYGIVKDYRGVDVVSDASLFENSDFRWAIITEIDESEIMKMLSGLRFNILLFVLISSAVALLVMFVITKEKKRQDEKLLYNATHDSLTQLPNRKFALEFLSYRLANTKRRKKKGAVLFIDLDRFKFINDSYGHKAGDHVLKEVSKRLKSVLRKDDLLARLGGDEFILIISDFQKQYNLDTICKKIIQIVSAPIEDTKRSYKVSLSIGIAIFPSDSNEPTKLLQFADTAMFKTKESGRNGYTYYDKQMTEKSLKISRVEAELKQAIENDELELYYQPQVNIQTNKIVGVEALIRWNHPRDGFVMPNDFIPIAEDSDLIIDVGSWVIKEACRSFKQWRDNGYELEYIAVNMSAKQIQCSECIKNLKRILKGLDFDPRWLELEITENVLIANFDNTIENINAIKDMGIKISIDDFGTGYSSLSYLKSLPISTLKIDRAFIKDILKDKDDLAIVSAIIAMGHTLNYNIIAEGAEEILEVELLKELRCDVIQGYYYSRPLAEGSLLKYFVQNNKKKDV